MSSESEYLYEEEEEEVEEVEKEPEEEEEEEEYAEEGGEYDEEEIEGAQEEENEEAEENLEEDGEEETENQPEDTQSILNRIAELDESEVGKYPRGRSALLTIVDLVAKTRKQLKPNQYEKIAVEMAALSRKQHFLQAFADLTGIPEFIIDMHKIYSVKLNTDRSVQENSLLVDTIRIALRKFMKHFAYRHACN